MTKRRFGKRSRFAVIIMAAALAAPSAWAQQAEPAPKPGKPINAGDVLSGELNAMKGGKKGKRAATYQITSEPRRLPPPNGLCNLETGPSSSPAATPRPRS
jgi:Flp pilus assembly secretin CpaC